MILSRSRLQGTRVREWLFPLIGIFFLALTGCREDKIKSDPDVGDEPTTPNNNSTLDSLIAEYTTFNAPKTNLTYYDFTNFTFSNYYIFWDGGHITGHGKALNTGDTEYQNLAILRTFVSLESRADDLMEEYFAIAGLDSNSANAMWISSAYRNPRRNDQVDGAVNSLHIYGQAIDFDNDNTDPPTQAQQIWDAANATVAVPSQLLNAVMTTNGIVYYQYRPEPDDQNGDTHWIHVAWGSVPQ